MGSKLKAFYRALIRHTVWIGLKKRHGYVVKGSLWCQDELSYEEDGPAKELLKRSSVILKENDQDILSIIDQLYDANVIPDLLDLVLKPFNPTPLHRLWNLICLARLGRPKKIVSKMRNSEIGEVIRDFFTDNAASMVSAASSFFVSPSSFPAMGIMSPQPGTKPSIRPLEEISAQPLPSGELQR